MSEKKKCGKTANKTAIPSQIEESRYRSLVENTPDVIMRFDRQLRHLFVSTNVEQVTGIKPEAFIGKTHRELGFPEEKCRFWENTANAVFESETPYETEFEYEGPQGAIIFNWRLVPEFDGEGNIESLLSIARDITEHRRTEREFTQLFNTIPAGFALHEIMLDSSGQPLDYRFLDINPAFEKLTGLKRDVILGKTALEVLPNIEQEWIERYGHVALTGETIQFENYSRELKSHYEVTAYSPEKGKFVTIFHDVTERKKTEESLRRDEILLKIAGRATRLGGWQYLIDENRLLWSNEIADIHEVPPDFVPTVEEGISFYAPEWQERIRKIFSACVEKGVPYDEEMEIITAKEHRLWVRTLGEAEYDVAGNIVSVQGAFMDITNQKRAETISAETEIRYQNLFSNLPDAIFINIDNKVCHVNQACVDLFAAKSEDDLLGKSHFDLFPEEYHEITSKRIHELRDLGKLAPPIEKKIIRLDGKLVDVEVTAAPFPYKNTNAIHVMLRDITERKQREKELQESERRFRQLFESLTDAIFIRSDQDRFVLTNPAASELLGYSREELLQLGPLDIVVPEYQNIRPKLIKQLETKGTTVFDSILVDCKGKKIPVECSGRTILFDNKPAVLCIIRDMTEHKAVEEALRESEAKHRLLAENTLDTIWQMDMHTRFTYVNNAISTFGYTPQEFTGTKLGEHCSPENMTYMASIIADAVANKKNAMFETELFHRNGAIIPVEIVGKVIFDDNNMPISMQGITRDISERKKAEKEQQILQEQLIQAQKMESIGRLAGGVAHDFNNMLGVILGNIDMALDQVEENSTLHTDLEEVRQAAKRSVEITRQLLTFARKEKISPIILDLNQSLENMLKMLRRLIGENINLVWQANADFAQIMMDPTHIDQMMTNLCLNARDAIGKSGTITIITTNTILDNLFCDKHPDLIPGEYVTILVQDTGCGMSEETIEHIFEPFFTTKEHGKGTGLGLATIYGIVKQSNGCLEVTSIKGEGTLFTIHLPLVSDETAITQETREYRYVNTTRGRETILVVEDEPGILKLCKNILSRAGYTVLEANTPIEALHLSENYEEDIHLIITDIIMPELNGPELIKKIMTMRPDIKCLYMSGYSTDMIDHKKLLTQNIHCIEKPFSSHRFTNMVHDILNEKNN